MSPGQFEVADLSLAAFSTQDHAAAAVAVGPDGTPGDPKGIPVFTKEQADYIGVPVDGPYKPETYRY